MSTNKLKSFGEIVKAYNHDLRVDHVENADRELADLNETLIAIPDGIDIEETWQKRINDCEYYKSHGIRSNAVMAYEVVMTMPMDHLDEKTSREWQVENQAKIENWKKANMEWLHETFDKSNDGKSNILTAVYHGDENGNVHCHALIVPIDDRGRLNASFYTGGSKAMIDMQTKYAEKMKPFGLERGIRNSKAKHTDIKRFYSALNRRMEIPEMREGESFGEYIERTKEEIQTQMAAAYKKQLDDERRSHESIAKRKNMESQAIQKELDVSHELEMEKSREVFRSVEKLEQKQQEKKLEISRMEKKIEDLNYEAHNLEFSMQYDRRVVEKSKKYDTLVEKLDEMKENDPVFAEKVEQMLSEVDELTRMNIIEDPELE